MYTNQILDCPVTTKLLPDGFEVTSACLGGAMMYPVVNGWEDELGISRECKMYSSSSLVYLFTSRLSNSFKFSEKN